MIFREKFGPEVDQSKFFGPEVDPSKFFRNQDPTRTFLKGSRPDLHPKKRSDPALKNVNDMIYALLFPTCDFALNLHFKAIVSFFIVEN